MPGDVGDIPATEESDGVLADGDTPLGLSLLFPQNFPTTDLPFLCPLEDPDPPEPSEPELFLLSLGEAEMMLMGVGT